jgi:hypothetical protein
MYIKYTISLYIVLFNPNLPFLTKEVLINKTKTILGYNPTLFYEREGAILYG